MVVPKRRRLATVLSVVLRTFRRGVTGSSFLPKPGHYADIATLLPVSLPRSVGCRVRLHPGFTCKKRARVFSMYRADHFFLFLRVFLCGMLFSL
uniref:Putative secreted protein n=1 Tax=Ixodes ricinus TaxID=34613 RepID=A0A6B0UC72_IXORI